MMQMKYTIESVVNELRQLVREDIPEEYRNWAKDGLVFIEKHPDADILDFPNNIFGYIRKEPMPERIRELVEGIYLQAISQGSGMAACNLGALYYTGQIGEQSYEKAMYYYEIAADSGDSQAVENLGYCYYYGRDCEVDYKKAFECFAKGAFTGSGTSLYKIADMYKNGYYVNKDENEAFRICDRLIGMINGGDESAGEYDADVYVRIADFYLNGTGCEKDLLTALFWAQRAEIEFRRRDAAGQPFARSGVEWAMRLISRCRAELDSGIQTVQPS